MLYLNEQAINRAVSMIDVMDGIDQSYALYEQSDFNMPMRTQVQDDKNTLVLMPCFTEENIATKLVTVFPDNAELKKPTIHGMIVLNCNKTGTVKALMDGAFVTGLRTGAIGGSAIRHLARPDVTTLAVIGTGVQGYFQTIAACNARDFEAIYIYNRTPGEKVKEFVEKLRTELGTEIQIYDVDTPDKAIKQADVIITATTSSEPVLPNDPDILSGKLIIGVGSFQPTMREFPEALYEVASRILVDSSDAIDESGDIATPLQKEWISEQDVQTFSSYLKEEKTMMAKGETIVFKSTGMALFDNVVASVVYESAIKGRVGITLD